MLQVINLHCERDDRILFHNLNFKVEPGDVLQVQGANGSGKTTLLRILCGLNSYYEGDVLWQGIKAHSSRSDFSEKVFYLGHMPAIKKSLTAGENLRWFCSTQGHGDDTSISAALAEFNLSGYEDFPCHLMSAGQQRRVSLARLSLTAAPLWILDEPFTSLDKDGVEALENFLARHAQEGGAVILTTHHSLRMPCAIRNINLDKADRKTGVEA